VRPAQRARNRSERGDRANLARLRTFRSLLNLVLDPRTLSEALVPLTADRAVMDEHVLAAVVLGDEAVALRFAFIYEALRMSLFFGNPRELHTDGRPQPRTVQDDTGLP
jgi:hypothetical protein